MTKKSATLNYSKVFEALGHEKRLSVFAFIYRSGTSGARPRDIVENIGIDSGTLDFHLKRLLAVNLVSLRKDEHRSFYASNVNIPQGLASLFESPDLKP